MTIAIGVVLIAILSVGVLFMINSIGLFKPSMRPRVEFDLELLTGHIASVTAAMSAVATGAIACALEGRRHAFAAMSLDGTPIQAGADVVIERIENGLAIVERWVVVEGRI